MSHRPQIRESNTLRASILDAVMQLGALDNNNPITEWMFEDPANSRSARNQPFLRTDYDYGSLANTYRERQYGNYTRSNTAKPVGAPSPPPQLPPILPSLSTQQSTSSLSSRFSSAFRSRSKSRNRSSKKKEEQQQPTEGRSSAGYETDEGYTSSSPSKSKRRLFANKPNKADGNHESGSPGSPLQENALRSVTSIVTATTEQPRSSESPTPIKSRSFRMFGRKRREVDEGKSSPTQKAEEFLYSASSIIIDDDVPSSSGSGTGRSRRDAVVIEEGNLAGDDELPIKLSRKLSFAVPRAALKNPFGSDRRKTIRHRPSLLHIPKNKMSFGGGNDAQGLSNSLPPSPFILVVPEGDQSSDLATPYILCSPLDDLLPAQLAESMKSPTELGTPVYPISVSSIQRSLAMDSMDFRTSAGGAPALKRSMSMQATPRVAFADDIGPGRLKRGSMLERSYTTARRGREAPFPTRPILPLPLSLTMQGANARAVRLSLDARASVLRQRYQDGSQGGATELAGNRPPPSAFM